MYHKCNLLNCRTPLTDFDTNENFILDCKPLIYESKIWFLCFSTFENEEIISNLLFLDSRKFQSKVQNFSSWFFLCLVCMDFFLYENAEKMYDIIKNIFFVSRWKTKMKMSIHIKRKKHITILWFLIPAYPN